MRNRNAFFIMALLIAPSLLWPSLLLAAEDPAIDASSVFKRRAKAITALGVDTLEKQAVDKLCHDAKAPTELPSKRIWPIKLLEIGGSGGNLTATFQLPDGSSDDYRTKAVVPGIGQIRAIHPLIVETTNGHTYRVETPDQ